MITHPFDVPMFEDDGRASIYLDYPTATGDNRLTWRVDAETLDAVLALLDERSAD